MAVLHKRWPLLCSLAIALLITSNCSVNAFVPSRTYFVAPLVWRSCRTNVPVAFLRPRVSPMRVIRPRRYMVNLDSNDPFQVLDLSPSPSLDKKEIKRAYKRMALKYHPDVVLNSQSTPDEKRKANDVFAKINWAYETLSGKRQAETTTSSSSTGSGSGYTPPHRRKGPAYNSSTRNDNASTDWRDYMPKYDEADYETGGDSFGAIFSDLLAGAVGTAAGTGGVFRDFVDFLERNVDGFSKGGDDDYQLITLLQGGSLEEVGMEMDDTELVVQQLSTKLSVIDKELVMRQADLKVTTRYVEKLEFEEAIAELQARKKVVDGYLQKSRKRLLSLQTRYKELIVAGHSDVRAGGRSSRGQSYSSSSSSGASSSTYTRTSGSGDSSSQQTSKAQSGTGEQDTQEDSWKTQGFGSSGRGRGSGRRPSRSPDSNTSDRTSRTAQEQSASESQGAYRSSSNSEYSSTSSGSKSQPQMNEDSSFVPPHRRSSGNANQAQDDRRRLREH